MILEDNYIYDKNPHMYRRYDFDNYNSIDMLNNKLFCTFSTLEHLDNVITNIISQYKILYNKIFVLHIQSNNEYVCTYNIDQGNITSVPDNTIFVHRKKDFNTLYSLNGLNEVIKSLNNGKIDPNFSINWPQYKNSIILTREGQLKILRTKIYKIIEL
jgi:hypothetical protein